MNPRLHFLYLTEIALLILCAGCNDDTRLADQAKKAATAQEWHAWAAEVLARSKTNAAPIPRSEWPAFIRHISAPCTEWQLLIGRNGNISLVSLGGFCSYGISFGGPTFVEPQNPNLHITKVYPGVYVVSN